MDIYFVKTFQTITFEVHFGKIGRSLLTFIFPFDLVSFVSYFSLFIFKLMMRHLKHSTFIKMVNNSNITAKLFDFHFMSGMSSG